MRGELDSRRLKTDRTSHTWRICVERDARIRTIHDKLMCDVIGCLGKYLLGGGVVALRCCVGDVGAGMT
jgi:hypothetical protein